MINILNKIWKFLNSKVFMYAVILLVFLFIAGQCAQNSNLKRESKRNDQNISALNDSISNIMQENGELQLSKDALFTSEKQLKELNSDLYREVKDQKGKVVSLNKTILVLTQNHEELNRRFDSLKSIAGNPVLQSDSTYKIPWVLAYNYDSINNDRFEGYTHVDIINKTTLEHISTRLTNRQSQIELIWGQKVEDDKLRVFVQSGYPGLSAKSLDGVLIDPNSNKYIRELSSKRHWFTGFGIGPTLNIGYDFLHNQPAVILGIGIHYNIFEW